MKGRHFNRYQNGSRPRGIYKIYNGFMGLPLGEAIARCAVLALQQSIAALRGRRGHYLNARLC